MPNIDQSTLEYIKAHIRNIPDFPKPGIQFKDITPVLSDAKALHLAVESLASPFLDQKIDMVVGLEARGFLFGTAMALKLNAGFIPIRKPNKLPADTVKAIYELEYGTDSVEMHADAIKPGMRILIHDDLIATGGTAKAATQLVRERGGDITGFSFLVGLKDLHGKDSLPKDIPVVTLIEF